ncbi:hypothetical protein C0Q70_17486 [Pomacea canaliculata]|uniref:Uncharacterized protein n=1 Tax=Pomacea canaliculata TaxID=400727 RepID=A0A2T7NKJ0_POMCA|nr:hypothetical protein C0Q70_17486 [Pomacea canaliculata]
MGGACEYRSNGRRDLANRTATDEQRPHVCQHPRSKPATQQGLAQPRQGSCGNLRPRCYSAGFSPKISTQKCKDVMQTHNRKHTRTSKFHVAEDLRAQILLITDDDMLMLLK